MSSAQEPAPAERVVVTGGAGYVGSRVSAHLIERGFHVIVLDKLLYGGDGLLGLLDHPRFHLVVGDVRDEACVRKVLAGAGAVVHMAALVGEPACLVDEDATVSINEVGTRTVVRAAEDAGVGRLVFLSTCSNYGVSDPGVLAGEGAPLRPHSHYARTKVEGEGIVADAADRGLATVVLRLATVCGVSPRMRFDLLVNDLGRSAALRLPIEIYAPEAWRPFLHIRDAARVIDRCLRAAPDALRGRVFNVVGENCRKRELAELVERRFPGIGVLVVGKDPDRRDYRVAAERITSELGFRPRYTVEDAFVEVAGAVRRGAFSDPHSSVYRSLPEVEDLGPGREREPAASRHVAGGGR